MTPIELVGFISGGAVALVALGKILTTTWRLVRSIVKIEERSRELIDDGNGSIASRIKTIDRRVLGLTDRDAEILALARQNRQVVRANRAEINALWAAVLTLGGTRPPLPVLDVDLEDPPPPP